MANASDTVDTCNRCYEFTVCTNRRSAFAGICEPPPAIARQTSLDRALEGTLCDSDSMRLQMQYYKCYMQLALDGVFEQQDKQCQQSESLKSQINDQVTRKQPQNASAPWVAYCSAKLHSDCVYSAAVGKCGPQAVAGFFSRIDLAITRAEDFVSNQYEPCPTYTTGSEPNMEKTTKPSSAAGGSAPVFKKPPTLGGLFGDAAMELWRRLGFVIKA